MQDYENGYQRPAPLPAHYRHSQTDLTEWDENQSQHNGNGHQNGHHQQQQMRRSMISNGGSQERYADERRDFYQYRNGNVSREDFGEEMADRRRVGGGGGRDNSVISNAVLNHLAGLHRRPVNRVSWKRKFLGILRSFASESFTIKVQIFKNFTKFIKVFNKFTFFCHFRAQTCCQQLFASWKNSIMHLWKSLNTPCDVELMSWLKQCRR